MANGEALARTQIVIAIRITRLEGFGHVKRRDETENIRAVVKTKIERPRVRPRARLLGKDTTLRSELRHLDRHTLSLLCNCTK